MIGPVNSILIYGAGLAFEYVTAALSSALPESKSIVAIENLGSAKKDALYGNVSTPAIYNFHHNIGLSEPDLVLNTDTVFSYGTHYKNWGANEDWVQCFSLPFPVWDGVEFHHYLTRIADRLEPYLPGAMATKAGRFAHPPRDPKVILSRAEYGYQFDPQNIAKVLKTRPRPSNVTRLSGALRKTKIIDNTLHSIELESGEMFDADLFVDASGIEGSLIGQFDNRFVTDRNYNAAISVTQTGETGPPCRTVTASEKGWISSTPLKDRVVQVSVSQIGDPVSNEEDADTLDLQIGRRGKTWIGNCVAVGHASAVIEPLTPAPIVLLRRDIERLLSLIPNSAEMSVESREFNRLFDDDHCHARLFNDAFYITASLPQSPFWDTAKLSVQNDKLNWKIDQYESRGALINFDLEPFNAQDWVILHAGIGRLPERYDVFANQIPLNDVEERLENIKKSVSSLVPKMPPHDRYLTNMKNYLEKKK